ncbi:hypothetical protein DXG03_000938 [Asterophora parasitica]|uniref:lytic cellulose monooxygenase (C4-dehydrogenating) n=1 Tax=Asterophora parasitica TaxID=117018 RepID=A0A9P7G612_9AGAR|nr:hypothetical protein DXG03_000938 [Asterophora parasitica]
MKSFSTLLLPLVLAASALAHGVVTTITIDGKTYTGSTPNQPKKPSIIRYITDASPVKGAKNDALGCGPGADPASDVAEAMPGSKISFLWVSANNANWPHDTGPMLTYMASCGDTPCNKFDSKNAKWFKIDDTGRKDGNNPKSKWVQADTMYQRAPAFVTIPKTIAPGNYLIRHEIIGLHLANEFNGAEFYPSCAQLHIGGSQTGKPTASELVSLPGAYSNNDPGIFYKAIFDSAPYTFPGPKVASFVNGTPAAGGNPTSTPTGTGSGPKATPTKSASGGCKLKKNSVQARSVNNAATVRPRHLSRVMRGLIAGRSSS